MAFCIRYPACLVGQHLSPAADGTCIAYGLSLHRERAHVALQTWVHDLTYLSMVACQALMRATDMLVCGEDLGMIPACVPPVMDQLGLVGAHLQSPVVVNLFVLCTVLILRRRSPRDGKQSARPQSCPLPVRATLPTDRVSPEHVHRWYTP